MRTPQPWKSPKKPSAAITVGCDTRVSNCVVMIVSVLRSSISQPCGKVSYDTATGVATAPKYSAILVAALLLSSLFQLVGCTGSSSGEGGTSSQSAYDKTIIIGGDFATSGADATAGVPVENGVRLAIEQEAAKGLPGGYQLRAQMLDDTVNGVHNDAQGVRNIQALLQNPHLLAIVGPQNSDVARAEIPVANQAKIALVSPTTTSISLTDDASGAAALRRANPALHTFYRTVMRDDLQGAADAQYAYHDLHAGRAYVIDDNEAYGLGIADVFAREFAREGGMVIERSHLTAGQQDFMPLLTRAEATKPDLIYFGGVVSSGAGLLRRQMVELGMRAIFMGGDGIKEDGFIAAAGASANGVYCSAGAPNLVRS